MVLVEAWVVVVALAVGARADTTPMENDLWFIAVF